jgi:signal transduction histidine kinase
MGVLEAFGERVGLSSMQERISLLGGRFEVNSAPGEGTTVTVEVPIYAGEGESG